jgi:hypothetical protein
MVVYYFFLQFVVWRQGGHFIFFIYIYIYILESDRVTCAFGHCLRLSLRGSPVGSFFVQHCTSYSTS